VLDFAADLKAHGGDPAQVQHVCMDMSAAYAKGAGMALPNAAISYDRFHVIAMAIQAMDEVRREELRIEPRAVAEALAGADPKTRRNLLWGIRKSPSGWNAAQTGAMHWLQRSALKSARAWRLRMALRGVYARARQHNDAAQAAHDLRLDELGASLQAGAFQEAGRDDQGSFRRGRAQHDRPPQQRLRRGHERAASTGQASRTRIPHRA